MAPIAAERGGGHPGTVGVEIIGVAGVPSATATRRRILHGAALTAGTIVAGGVAITGLGLPGPAASAPSAAQDVEILNFALRLEHLQAAFYAATAGVEVQPKVRAFLDTVAAHEEVHVAYLRRALGDDAIDPPTFDLGTTTASERRIVATAVVLEDVAVYAYNGQAPNLTRRRLAAAASVVSADARHAAWIRSLVGRPAAPAPVDRTMTADEVEAAIARTGIGS